jgi:hypothetical protein
MLRLRIALYRHIPSGAVAKCFQLPISLSFSFCLFPVFWAATEFSFSAILFLFLFLFFSFLGFFGQV